ncbi:MULTISPECIES: tRNA (N(6)-L-threonylcarbamoyladenosine(37)-C(2))-methylthiotransferase [Methanobacterium]|jgi:MiaB-like tRNA modifying enzyme|uniref:tRNA-t(6)A37 methylthiotransferase n=1 Tax=Methanobacterium bryantii TaxID=2161 RepID=A0A2A2H9Q2_METBR|nr:MULTISPECIES: tRNA (N(6)-L-threonylcarbamoyladenosine(37)-C(2))-methylthiotransferase [Methanobacterium]OEC87039.1 threonylcarbamoyladenosine tRNA methylthiotransferase [Methanobacterium sp. A39]PAV06105.1 threonylcarbamoyladenosine tRNA methylthiotransferase [Methanobacterium bryantii]
MKVYIDTFGCTFNQGDSQIMAGLLQEDNAQLVSKMEDADVIILNTCYVKQPTEQKVINRIKKVQEQFPDKKLIISGCMVEIDPDKLKKAAPSAGWIGPRQIKSTIDVVKSCMNDKTSRITGHSDDIKAGLLKIRFNPFVHISQICEGCVGRCTYCCTRFARGKLQSYPVEDIKKEIESAVEDGCVEIQLTAQDTAAYGMDTGGKLSELIKEITTIPGDFRLRVGMMHPKSMMRDLDELIEVFMHKNVYNFMHIPIQSGSDPVLNHMGRDHTVVQYKDIISKVREKIPEISIATDIIVGYPTETDEDFEDTLKLIGDIKPNFIHISKYRHRPKAISSSMPEIDHNIMKKRSKALNDLKSKILYQNNLAEIGKVYEILITEKGSKGGYIGRTDSYKHVVIENGEIGTFVKVKIDEVTSTYLKGTIYDN